VRAGRITRKERERRRQRQVVILTGVTIGLALVALLGGLAFDQLWVPSRPVAQVGGTTLTRGEYWQVRRAELARTIGQSLYLGTFGEQFAQQFLGQIGQLDTDAAAVRTAAISDPAVDQWAELQTIRQAAASQFGIQASDAEIAQELIGEYGTAFAPPTPAISPTIALPTTAPLPTSVLTPTTAVTTTADGPTATLASTATPPPTETPSPTPLADEALRRQDEVFTRLFEGYQGQVSQIDPQRRTNLTLDDFKRGVREQFERQVLTRKIQEQLVADASFTPTTEPSAIEARHILIAATAPLTATEQERETAFTEARPRAERLLSQIRDANASFADLASQNSDDYTTRPEGGTLPTFDKDGKTQGGEQIDPTIVQASLALEEGQTTTDLVRSPFGWHVVQLVRRTVDTREAQLRAARTEAFDAWLADRRKELTVQRFPAQTPSPTLLPTGTPAPLPTVNLAGSPSPTAPAEPTPLITPGAAPDATASIPTGTTPTAAATSAATATARATTTATAGSTATARATTTATERATAATAATAAATASPAGTTPTATP
jgi:parvulin-like peptidyl-prolyl isomerase